MRRADSLRIRAFILVPLLIGLGLPGITAAAEEVRWNATLKLPSSEGETDLATWSAAPAISSQMEPLGIASDLQGGALALSGHQDLDQLRRALFTEAADYTDFLGGPVELSLTLPRTNGPLSLALETRPATGYAWYLVASSQSGFAQVGLSSFETHGDGYGAGATQVIQLQPTHPGQGVVRLVYRRAFADPEPIHASLNVQFSRARELIELTDPAPAQLDSPPVQPTGFLDPGPAATLALPAAYDARALGIVPSIRDQKSCGSCWAFATVGVMEIATKLGGGPMTDLSEQFLVSCNLDGYGCNGGWFASKYHYGTLAYNQTAIGAVLEADKPYTATNGSCSASYSHPYKASQTLYVAARAYSIPSNDQIKSAIMTYGAVAAAVCVDNGWYSYTGGNYRPTFNACGGGVNHGIDLIGWDDASQTWLLRNSWGASWGDKGYMRIAYDPAGSSSKVGYDANVIQFAAPSHTLSVTSSGAAKVAVSANPTTYAGTTSYTKSSIAAGTKITLTSPAKSGALVFTGWSGCDSTSGTSCTLTMSSSKTINANYSPTYNLTVSSSGAAGVAISSSTPAYAGKTNYSKTGIVSGTSITLVAPATAGATLFKSWTGCASSSGTSCTVTMTASKTVTATYSPTYSLTVKSAGASAVPIDASATTYAGTAPYTKAGILTGTAITLTAPETKGATLFKSWTGCASTSGTRCTVTMTASKTVTVTYAPTYGITLRSAGASAVPISASIAGYAGTTEYSKTGIPTGTSITLTAPSTAGINRFKSWTGCTSVSGRSCVTKVTANKTLTVTYVSPPTYSLSVKSSGASAVSLNASPAALAGTADYSKTGILSGTSIVLTAPKTAGTANFKSWSGCSTTSDTSCTVVMTGNKTVKAIYSPTYSLSVQSSGASAVALQASSAAFAGTTGYQLTGIPTGTSITLTAPATQGTAKLKGWSGCNRVSGARCTVTLTTNRTLIAEYVTPPT